MVQFLRRPTVGGETPRHYISGSPTHWKAALALSHLLVAIEHSHYSTNAARANDSFEHKRSTSKMVSCVHSETSGQ